MTRTAEGRVNYATAAIAKDLLERMGRIRAYRGYSDEHAKNQVRVTRGAIDAILSVIADAGLYDDVRDMICTMRDDIPDSVLYSSRPIELQLYLCYPSDD